MAMHDILRAIERVRLQPQRFAVCINGCPGQIDPHLPLGIESEFVDDDLCEGDTLIFGAPRGDDAMTFDRVLERLEARGFRVIEVKP